MDSMQSGDTATPNADPESRKTLARPADEDEGSTVPNKMMKLAEDVRVDLVESNDTNQEDDIQVNDSDVDLGDEEEDYEDVAEQQPELREPDGDEDEEPLDLEADYAVESDQPVAEFDEDFEEGDTFDEDDDELGTTAEETEDNIQEEADSSTDLQDFVQANLAYIEDCQSDIDTLNHKANEEILLVELKYNKLRLPVYKRRNTYIERVPDFWATVFSRHRQLRQVLTKEDIKCLKHVTKLQVEDFEDNRAGYSIQFYFSENPWFDNRIITKEYHLPWHGSPSCTCTPIQWKKGMNLTMKSSSFFSWFTSQEDASADDIAEIIKDDLWPNPLQCYLQNSKQPEESDDDDEADESGNLNSKDDSIVLLDDAPDDEVEYISSEDEDEQSWQGGKGRSTTAQYTVQDDEGDEQDDEEYEEFDDEEPDVTGTSEPSIMQRNLQDRKQKGEVINIDDDYLGSEEDESEYYAVDLDGEDKLLQGQVENEEFEDSKDTEESHDKSGEERLPGEVEVQHADSSHEANEDSRHSNGVVGSSTNFEDDPSEKTDLPNELVSNSKMQDQSKVVSTSTTVDTDVIDGAT